MNKNHHLAATSNGNKTQLRKFYLEKRNNLNQEHLDHLSLLIIKNLLANFELFNKKIHLFFPIKDKKEINTWHLYKRICKTANNQLFTHIYSKKDEKWKCVTFDPNVPFIKDKFNIPTPKTHNERNANELDLIIIPLLVFDNNGHRIGYGKGIYDHILSQTNVDCKKIGISFFKPCEKTIDFESHDIPLDYCQTPYKLYQFK